MNMSYIELVIKIPEEYYNGIKSIPDNQCDADMLIIKYGTPLPKGHGRLIDADDAKSYFSDREGDDFTAFHFYDAVESTPTIIEADNLENEEHEHMTADELAELFTESEEDKE